MTDAQDRRERYEKVLRVVEYNTAGLDEPSPQLPAASLTSVVSIATDYGGDRHSGEQVRAAIAAAVENGDLIRFEDAEGTARLARTTKTALQQVAVWAAERDEPDREVVALANRAKA